MSRFGLASFQWERVWPAPRVINARRPRSKVSGERAAFITCRGPFRRTRSLVSEKKKPVLWAGGGSKTLREKSSLGHGPSTLNSAPNSRALWGSFSKQRRALVYSYRGRPAWAEIYQLRPVRSNSQPVQCKQPTGPRAFYLHPNAINLLRNMPDLSFHVELFQRSHFKAMFWGSF